uniref:Uncharacterized protein n=1 Tax=Meloidogyne javanica TaxID=6303 RepID=A0A915LIT5_MELJA
MVITVYFSVSVPFPVLDKHFVFVTGSSIKLGNWKANKALKLKKDKDDRWGGTTKLVGFPINYTYFIGYYIKSEKSIKKDVAVFQWETLLKPRSLKFSRAFVNQRVKLHDIFGEEGEDIKYNFDQVLPSDSMRLCQIKKNSNMVKKAELKKKEKELRKRKRQITNKNKQIKTLKQRVTELERDKQADRQIIERMQNANDRLTQRVDFLTNRLLGYEPNIQQQQQPNNDIGAGGNEQNLQLQPFINNNNFGQNIQQQPAGGAFGQNAVSVFVTQQFGSQGVGNTVTNVVARQVTQQGMPQQSTSNQTITIRDPFLETFAQYFDLSRQLDSQELWLDLFNDQEKSSAYSLSVAEKDKCLRLQEPGAYLLRLLGPVIWSRPEQIIVYIDKSEENLLEKNTSIDKDNSSIINQHLRLQCKASGFPTPLYQWLDDDRKLEGANQSSLLILRCPCTARNVFRCKVWNQVEEGKEWSEFYRATGKTFYSELVSDIVDLSSFAVPFADCENCYKQKMEELAKRLGDEHKPGNSNDNLNMHEDDPMTTIAPEELIASDKVALIISNRSYSPNMTNLITPHCDAETLADALQQLNFKTVTLGDLNLSEMKQMINAYKKLLGEGVYAIFYFAGHGFEANGQCYLLPIGAPANDYGPQDCLSMDLVMNEFRDFHPALNLILLDMCRRFLPLNIDAFVAYSERFRQGEIKINRNTVYGYATSEGIGAYEVKGEMNGVFMKYLKKRIKQPRPLLDMLNKVFLDIERDPKVRDVQIPELRSNLTKQRTLLDPSVEDLIPKDEDFQEFMEGKNKEDLNKGEDGRMLVSDCKTCSEWALSHLAYLRFPEN